MAVQSLVNFTTTCAIVGTLASFTELILYRDTEASFCSECMRLVWDMDNNWSGEDHWLGTPAQHVELLMCEPHGKERPTRQTASCGAHFGA
jgi:hypothetical protein